MLTYWGYFLCHMLLCISWQIVNLSLQKLKTFQLLHKEKSMLQQIQILHFNDNDTPFTPILNLSWFIWHVILIDIGWNFWIQM